MFQNKNAALCGSPYVKKPKQAIIRDVLNEMLPGFTNDVEFLKGGLLSSAVIHEMLIQAKKRLAVHRYTEMATRLITPGSFPLWLLYGVQVAAAAALKAPAAHTVQPAVAPAAGE